MYPRPACQRAALVLVSCLLGAGCASFGYYGQAAKGHWELVRARRPVAEVIADSSSSSDTRRQLTLAAQARDFAAQALALPARGSYTHYVALPRPYVVWNVFATPPDSFVLRQSCFLFVGCLDYRGFFSEAEARLLAAQLQAHGDDVFIGGVAAYSTLGWFDDPLLSSMLRWDDATLIKTLFHELAHQRAYARDDTEFNEAFAMAVAEEGLRRWQRRYPLNADAAGESEREAAIVELALRYRERLAAMYATVTDPVERSRRKDQIYAALRLEFEALAANWPDRQLWTPWFEQDLNNAKLAAVAAYHRRVPQFACLIARVDGDLPAFYARVETLTKKSFSARRSALALACASGHNTGL